MRIIAHIDMDAFFAAVEERDKPWLKGKPIVVGSDPQEGRGVVSTANYRAREYGIGSATPIVKAWRLSEDAKRRGKPPVVFLGVRMERYQEVSEHIMAMIKEYSEHVEQASVDEAYIDMSYCGSYEKAREGCIKLKNEIKEKEQLTASIGIGKNKMIAKIASGRHKPDGLTVVQEHEVEVFLDPLPIRKIPGIGPKTESTLQKLKIATVGDAKRLQKEELEEMFGKWGSDIYEKVRGKDESLIVEEWIAKSIGEQETFPRDTRDMGFVQEKVNKMCERVMERIVQENFSSFRTIVITVRFADFETKTRAHTLSKRTSKPADSVKVLQFEALKLLLPFFDKRENPKGKLIRLVGVRVEKLE